MNTSNNSTLKSELHRPVSVEKLGLQKFSMDIVPSEGELKVLGERLKVDSLDAFEAQVSLQLLPNDDIALNATFSARLTQTCVITLDPVVSEIKSSFTTTYTHEPDENFGHDEEEFADLDDDIELPEPIIEGKIDVGEAVIEQLALEIDPFPRVKGATFDGYSTGNDASDGTVPEKKNPFAVLSKLKETPKS